MNFLILSTIFIFTVILCPPFGFSQNTIPAETVMVIDGDTIIMMIEGKKEWVDLLAIDAPEPTQPWGVVSQNALKTLVEGKQIHIEFDQEKHNHEGRLWGYLWAGETLVNHAMVLNGYALWDFWPPNVRYDKKLLDAEFLARKNWQGMWKSAEPSPNDLLLQHKSPLE